MKMKTHTHTPTEKTYQITGITAVNFQLESGDEMAFVKHLQTITGIPFGRDWYGIFKDALEETWSAIHFYSEEYVDYKTASKIFALLQLYPAIERVEMIETMCDIDNCCEGLHEPSDALGDLPF